MHEIDKIEYSRGCSVNFCEYSILIFYLVVFFPSGRPMVIFSLACLVVKNILSFGRSLYICLKSPAITNHSQGSLRIHAMVAAWQSSTSCSRASATCCSTATQLDRSPGPPGSWAAARQLPRKPWSRAGQLPSTWREPKLSPRDPRDPRDGMWTGFPAFVWRSVIDLVMCKARAIPAMRLAQFRHLWQPILGF